jgi:hypothetical protein
VPVTGESRARGPRLQGKIRDVLKSAAVDAAGGLDRDAVPDCHEIAGQDIGIDVLREVTLADGAAESVGQECGGVVPPCREPLLSPA